MCDMYKMMLRGRPIIGYSYIWTRLLLIKSIKRSKNYSIYLLDFEINVEYNNNVAVCPEQNGVSTGGNYEKSFDNLHTRSRGGKNQDKNDAGIVSDGM